MKCPSCGYLAFEPISSCPKCGELLKEIPEEGNSSPSDDVFEAHAGKPAAPPPPAAPETPGRAHPPLAGPKDADGLSPGDRRDDDRGWRWDELTPPEVQRPRAAAQPSRPPRAPMARRIAAGVIDHSVVLLTTLGLSLLSIALIGHDLLSLDFVGILPPLILFLLLADALYFTFFHGLGGQTLGEAICGITLMSSDATPLTFSRAFLRWTASVISVVPFGLGLFGGWHDTIAKTYVAKKI